MSGTEGGRKLGAASRAFAVVAGAATRAVWTGLLGFCAHAHEGKMANPSAGTKRRAHFK